MSLCNFNKDILRSVFAFVAFVVSIATSDVVSIATSGVGSIATCDVGSRVRILSKFLIGNNLLLKLLRTFSCTK